MRVAARKLCDRIPHETFNLFRHWHEGTPIDIKGHLLDVTKSKLATTSASKAEDLTLLCQNHSVNIATRCVNQLVLFQSDHTSRYGLIWIAILIGWETRSIRMT